MTDTITFHTEDGTPVRFEILQALTDLPDRPGTFVLLREDLSPLGFGFLDRSLAAEMALSRCFQSALTMGLRAFGVAVPTEVAPDLARDLGRAANAPINRAEDALHAIAEAQAEARAQVGLAAE